MNYIGIDFSLNSPGMVIRTPDELHWRSFANNVKINNKPFRYHKMFQEKIPNFLLHEYNRDKSKNYSENEVLKIDSAHRISDLIMSEIVNWAPCAIGFEGYSYGSKGNSLIDIVTYTSIVRSDIRRILPEAPFHVFSPTEVKKRAGKGNLNKWGMLEAFLKEEIDDPMLQVLKDEQEEVFKLKDIPNPIPDLVDAYWVSLLLLESN